MPTTRLQFEPGPTVAPVRQDIEAYGQVPRLKRKNPMNAGRREEKRLDLTTCSLYVPLMLRFPFLALGGLLILIAVFPAHATAPMSALFRNSAPNLVHVHAYHHPRRLAPSCGTHAPHLGACAGRNGTVVWRSLPNTLQLALGRSRWA